MSRDEMVRMRDSVKAALDSKRSAQSARVLNQAMAAMPTLAEKWSPQTPADRYALLGVLLAALSILITLQSARPSVTNTTINKTTINTTVIGR
jgi:hypothetical protein